MAGEADPLDISGDVSQHPPVDHPGRIKAEQTRAAQQTQGGPLSGLEQAIGRAGEGIGKAAQDVEGRFGQELSQTGQTARDTTRDVIRQSARFVLPPSVLHMLGENPYFGDNPWLPIPQNLDDPQMGWVRMHRLGKAWNVIFNPEFVQASVHDIINEHTTQGAIKRYLLGMDRPETQWVWENIMPQLLVATADGNPITGPFALAGQASEDPKQAAMQAWSALPWADYFQAAHQLGEGHPGTAASYGAAGFWKGITATMTIGAMLPELKIFGQGRLAIAGPWRRYTNDALKATRRLATDPETPPPSKLGKLVEGIQSLSPTVVRAARTKPPPGAPGAAQAAAPEVTADLTAHLEQIRNSLAAAGGPSQDRAAELMQRLKLLNITDPKLQQAFEDFARLKKGDFETFASFSATRQAKWDALMEQLVKTDASKVRMPSALNFLEAVDLDTLPTKVIQQLRRLGEQQIAQEAVRGYQQGLIHTLQRRAMRTLFSGLFGRDVAKRLQEQGVHLTPELAEQILPKMLPKMTEGQTAFLRAVWNKYFTYDLLRLHEEDVVPRELHEYLDELGDESKQHASQFIGTTYGILAFIQGGPHMLEDNAVESLVTSLLGRQRAHEAMLGQFFFPQMAALVDRGGVDMERAMDATRDDKAFEALPTEGKLIVDAWRHIHLLLRDRAMAIGHRSEFVGRFDPRVKVREAEDDASALLPRLRSGQGPIAGTSKAHRTEAFQVDPHDPTHVAIGEKYRTVRDLNAAMERAREEHVASLAGQGVDRVEAEAKARRRYPVYHQNLAYAMYEYLAPELRALNAKQAVNEMLHAWTPEGAKLAYEESERAAPEAYRPLRSAGRSFANVRFHPAFADSIDRANEHVHRGAFELAAKANNEAKQFIMLFPQIHAMNVAGRVLPMMLTHPWAAVEELLSHDDAAALKGLDPQMRKMYRVMQAMQNGVVPHKAAREFFTNVMSELGNATGDSRMFDVPAGVRSEDAGGFIRQRARQMPGLVGRITPGPLQAMNDKFWRAVFAFQVLAFHVEQRALRRRFPDMDPARVNMYAAFRGNRWGGAIEPEQWSQFGYHASRLLMFAPNWLRSFFDLNMPRYLKGELGASKELQQYVWEQEIRTTTAFLAGQQITGNALNYLLSGKSIYQNQPQNHNRIEVDPRWPGGRVAYEAMRAIDPTAVQGIDVNTGVNTKTGAPLTWENPFARQPVQLEAGLGIPGMSDQESPGAEETFGVSHTSPLVQGLAAAANVDLYRSARDGQWQHIDPTAPWNPDVLLPALLSMTPAGYTFGSAASQAFHAQMQAQPGGATQPQAGEGWEGAYKAWAQGLPVPPGWRDIIASLPNETIRTLFSNVLGVQTPYEKAETTKGTRLGDAQDAKLQKLLDGHHKVMADKSQALFSGKITPYQWRQWYQNYIANYDGQLQAYYQGIPEYKQGTAGLYHEWQQTYADAALPDGSGIDWGKLDRLQSDFRSKHTDAEMTAIKAYQAKNEHDYPALVMYRSVTDNHRAQQKIWAKQLGLTDPQLTDLLKGYGDVAGDRRASSLYLAQHPKMLQYLQLNRQWEINSPYGRMYSLFYHTAAMRTWLGISAETEQQGASQLEAGFKAA